MTSPDRDHALIGYIEAELSSQEDMEARLLAQRESIKTYQKENAVLHAEIERLAKQLVAVHNSASNGLILVEQETEQMKAKYAKLRAKYRDQKVMLRMYDQIMVGITDVIRKNLSKYGYEINDI
jgi:bisphosphoglycerate-dependent phosphoglycerate mutase